MDKLDQISNELNLLYSEKSKHLWTQYTTGLDLGVQKAKENINAFLMDKKTFEEICNIMAKSNDALEKRKAKILYNSFKKFHHSEKSQKILQQIQELETQLMDFINKYRFSLEGKEISSSELNQIYTQSADRSLRKAAHVCKIPLNQELVNRGFINLINLRKDLASSCQYQDFATMVLDEDDLTPDLFSGWAEHCRASKNKYTGKTKALAQKHLNLENLEPWDYGYLKNTLCKHNQETVDLTQFYNPIEKTFAKFGFDLRNLNLTFDIFPRKNKSEWGYNFTLETGKDSRVLANVTNKFSNYWVLLHETAHGVHFLGLNPEEKTLNNGVSGIVAEGFANYFGNLSYSREFLNEILSPDKAESAFIQFKDFSKVMHLQNFNSLSETLFDHQLYKTELKTAKDISDLKSTLDSDLFGETSSVNESPWAKLIHHTSHPIYLHNYFLGDVMCEKMKDVFIKNYPGKNADELPSEFGLFWREKVLSPSGRFTFTELYESVCEEKVSIKSYLDQNVFS